MHELHQCGRWEKPDAVKLNQVEIKKQVQRTAKNRAGVIPE